jgi:hypothetical protein
MIVGALLFVMVSYGLVLICKQNNYNNDDFVCGLCNSFSLLINPLLRFLPESFFMYSTIT